MMSQPAFSAALSPHMAARTAQAWYEQAASMAATAVAVSDMALSLSQAADRLLNAAAGTPVQPEPQVLPSNVFSLGAARAARAARQAVQR